MSDKLHTDNGNLHQPIIVSGDHLTLEAVTRVARDRVPVQLSNDATLLKNLQESYHYVQQAVQIGEPIYGVTSGFGGMAHVVVPKEEAEALQNNLPRFHKVGAGRLLPEVDIRASLLLRANSLMRGISGIRLELIQRLEIFLNAGVTPHVYDLGSIGASGDLTPLAYITGCLVGLDKSYQVTWNGETLDAITVLERLGLPRLRLQPKESLAIMNGTSVMTGIAANCMERAWTGLAIALNTHALFLQALNATNQSFHPFVHHHKPHPGQVWTAAYLLDLLTGSQLIRDDMYGRNNYRPRELIQDRYSLRCLPQYLGPIVDGFRTLTQQIEVEMNSATDNPLIDVANQASYHGGNFLGQYIGIAMDQLRYYLGLTAKHLDVQIALLVSPEFNQGLSPSLVGNPARQINMGLKGLQITGNSIMPLITFFGNSLVDRFPTHAEQFNQNINSQGFGSANLARQTVELFEQYLAIALIFGVQAVELRTFKQAGHYDARTHLSPATAPWYETVCQVLGRFPTKERPLIWNDDEQSLEDYIRRLVTNLQTNGTLPQSVQETISRLKHPAAGPFSWLRESNSSELGILPATRPIDWEGFTKLNIAQCLELGQQHYPSRPALKFEGQIFTYQALNEAANRVANSLTSLGVQRGDRVALLLPNIPAFAYSYHGIQKIGAIVVSLNIFLKPPEIAFILNDSGATVLITTAALRANVTVAQLPQLKSLLIAEGEVAPSERSLHELMRNASPQADAITLSPESPAAIVYTSGTSGFPKGATLSQSNIIFNILAKKRYLGIQPSDQLLLFLPLFHCFGQNAVLNSGLGAGATLVLQRQFEPEAVRRAVAEDHITMLFGVPTTFVVMYDKLMATEMQQVRYYFSAAAPLPMDVAHRWQTKFGAFIYQGYGLTETSPFASYNHLTKPKLGSIGTPIDHVDMQVVDTDTGQPLRPGEIGELVIRGACVMLGYWNRTLETAEVLKNGWFHTGDLGKMDYEGYFYLVDRLKDMINVGGLKVYPAEVEKLLAQHPAVAEVAVYGLPEPVMGEQVVASVVLTPGETTTAEEIMTFGLSQMANFKVPTRVEFVPQIPKSPTGKVLRRLLQERAISVTDNLAPPTVNLQNAQTIQVWILEWIAQQQQVPVHTIEPEKTFAENGMNSVANVKLTQALGKWLGLSLEVVLTWKYPTIVELAKHLELKFTPNSVESPASASAKPFAEYVPYVSSAVGSIELWPSVAEFFVYDELLYSALTHDERRNHSYRLAFQQRLKDKVVVEIGTGKDAILSRLAVAAGAKKIYAIERHAPTCQQAQQRVQELGLADQITLIHGDATQVQLPELADACISEIVGSIGGSEGAAVILNQARRFLKPDGVMIPERSLTKLAAVTFPAELANNLGFTSVSGHYTQQIFEQVGYPFDVRLCVKNFPKTLVLSEAGTFEDLDYTKPLATAFQHHNRLIIQQAGRFDGVLVWLTLHTIAGEVIDILEHEHSWLPIYFPLFTPGIEVVPGDLLEVTCTTTLCENQLNPDYHLQGRVVAKSGRVVEFQYDSYHHRRVFKHTPFYERLFAHVPTTEDPDRRSPEPGIANPNTRSEAELANLLAAELETLKRR